MADLLKVSIEAYIKDDKTEGIEDVATAVIGGKAKLLSVVEGLGPYLTHSETSTRVKGIHLLTEVINRVPITTLNAKELEVLATFFTDRMKDHHSVTPYVLQGMKSLCHSDLLPADSMSKMLRAVFGEIHLQSMAQADRRHFYEMCLHLLHHRLRDIYERGAEFVCGFVQSMDGEKDPRNLVIAFDCVHIIATCLPLDVFVEELFEVVSCYFPIEFTPSAKDPSSLTKDDLVLGLRKCLIANAKFAEFCLPLLLEKMTSSFPSAKVDAMETLAAGAATFGAANLAEYKASFWAAIRRDVFSGTSDAVVTAALATTAAIAACLSPAAGSASLLDEYVEDVFTDTKRYLSDPDQQFMSPSASLLKAVASGSLAAADRVLGLTIPLLMETFNQKTQVNLRVPTLESLNAFIHLASVQHDGKMADLSQFTHDLCGIYFSLMNIEIHHTLRALSVRGMIELLGLPDLLSDEEKCVLAKHLLNITLTDNNDAVVTEANEGLAYIGAHHPAVVLTDVVPVLSAKLESGEDAVMAALASASSHESIMLETVPLLLGYLDKLNDEEYDRVINISRNLCGNVVIIMRTMSELSGIDDLIKLVLSLCTTLVTKGAGICKPCILNDTSTVLHLSTCARLIAPRLSEACAQQVTSDLLGVFTEGRVPMTDGEVTSQPLYVTSPPEQTRLIGYFSAIQCGLRSVLPAEVTGGVLDRLTEVALSYDDTDVSLAAMKCVAGLVNKMESGESLNGILLVFQASLKAKLSHSETRTVTKQRCVILLSWLTKALVLRGHPHHAQWIDSLLELFQDLSVSKTAADGFYVILNEFEDIMTPAMHADAKIMYRQRFFVHTLNKVVAGYEGAATDQRACYLTALSHLLRFVPKQVLAAELPNLVPLLLQSLYLEAPELWLSTLTTFCDLLQDTPDVLKPHMDALITQLLRFSLYTSDMRVRLSSLRCLGLLIVLPHHAILPHQNNVTKTLAKCLDDHKRLVRQAAVAARTEWFLVGAPGT